MPRGSPGRGGWSRRGAGDKRAHRSGDPAIGGIMPVPGGAAVFPRHADQNDAIGLRQTAVRVVALLLAGSVSWAQAADPPAAGRVVAIADGDTLTVLDDANAQHKIRISGIDAPEKSQPFGTAARRRLGELVAGQTVALEVRGRDKYGRTLARVAIKGQDIGEQLVGEGLAWHYKRFDNDAALAAAEAKARAARRGLWSDKEPVPPWEWRANQNKDKNTSHR